MFWLLGLQLCCVLWIAQLDIILAAVALSSNAVEQKVV